MSSNNRAIKTTILHNTLTIFTCLCYRSYVEKVLTPQHTKLVSRKPNIRKELTNESKCFVKIHEMLDALGYDNTYIFLERIFNIAEDDR